MHCDLNSAEQGFTSAARWPYIEDSFLQNLSAGGACQALAFPVNLGPFGNSIAIWLGIRPADLFLYIFLPPMLLDASMRIDFFLFRKVRSHGNACAITMHFVYCTLYQMMACPCTSLQGQLNPAWILPLQVLLHVMSFAFLVVGMSTALTTVVLLYIFNLREHGWQWFHGALFSAMMASTDCVAVSALLKASK